MIKTIELNNFQPHHNTIIQLHESVNVIQGLSDSGKSALLRGIDAVLRRAPFYLTHNKESGKNTITFDNLDVISRSFTKTKINKCPSCKEKVTPEMQVCESCGEFLSVKSSEEFYMINDEKRDRFGKTLPEFITDFTRIKPIEFLDNEIFLNFAKQHEPLFFVSDLYTGSLRNKMISMLLPDSDKIDVLIKDLNSEKLSTSANIKVYSKQQLFAEESLNMIQSDFVEAETAFNSLSKLELDIRQAEHNLGVLVALQSQLNNVLSLAKLSTTVIKFGEKIESAFRLIAKTQDNDLKLKTLKTIEFGLQSLNKYDNIDMIEFALFDSLDDDINELIKKSDQLRSIKACSIKLSQINIIALPSLPVLTFPDGDEFKLEQLCCLKYNHETLNKRISENHEILNQIKKEVSDLQKELNGNKMICPITNKPFCSDCVEVLKNELV